MLVRLMGSACLMLSLWGCWGGRVCCFFFRKSESVFCTLTSLFSFSLIAKTCEKPAFTLEIPALVGVGLL